MLPALLRRTVESLPADRLARAPREGEWSALETLTHIRDVVVHAYGLRLRRLLYENDPEFANFEDEAFRKASLARGESAAHLLAITVAEQEQLARLLEHLPDSDWGRQGRHPQYGAMSIEFLARRVGEHAEEHAVQMVEAIKASGGSGSRS